MSEQQHELPATDAFEEPPPALEKAAVAPNQDDWDTNPDNPKHWSSVKKVYHTSVPALIGFICTLGSSIITSGFSSIESDFNVSQELATLTLSLYVLGIAFGPIIAAPLSEHFGRRIVYLGGFLASCFFTLGAGFSQNFSALLACRFFAGFFSGPVLSVGSGTIADVHPPVDRATSIAVFTGTAFFGPILGPVMGGFAVENTSWRWTQWIILFWASLGCVGIILLNETHKGTILRRQKKQAKKDKINSQELEEDQELKRATSATSKEATKKGWNEVKNTFTVLLFRPIRMLFTEPILFSITLYISFNFGVFYAFFAGFPIVFQGVYGFNLGIFGLTWLGLLVGSLAALAIIIACDQRIYRPRHFRAIKEGKMGGISPENRLYPAMYACVAIPVSLFWFGWTSRADIHWIVPIVASGFFTLGNLCVFVSGLIYLTDTYGALLGASALAANGLLRYAFGMAFPLFSRQMYDTLGIGWTSSLLGFVSVGLCVIPFVLFRYGPRLRARSGREELG